MQTLQPLWYCHMHKAVSYLFTTSVILAQTLVQNVHAEADATPLIKPPVSQTNQTNTSLPLQPTLIFTPFTGKIVKNKVRIRLQPNLDGIIVRELNRFEVLLVVGETNDFYAVQPPADIKAYVFRTYVLDDAIVGDRVNVRLEPNVTAPILGQMNSGERVQIKGTSPDKKWLEIAPTDSIRLYICKEYVEKIGDPALMATMEKRREETNQLLNSAYLMSQSEMKKPFEQIHLEEITQNLNKVADQYADFPVQAGRAKELLNSVLETYLQKKLAYAETLAQPNKEIIQATNTPSAEMPVQAEQNIIKTTTVTATASASATVTTSIPYSSPDEANVSSAMAAWIPTEKRLYENWAAQNEQSTTEDFYKQQMAENTSLRGIIEPYNRSIRNKPGDFVLLNQSNQLPIAYLYSTQVNLQDKIGQTITIQVAPRENNHFAFPAYFVLSAE